MDFSKVDLVIDNPALSTEEIKKLVEAAEQKKVNSISVLPVYVPTIAKLRKDKNVKLGVFLSFPLGMDVAKVKAKEAEEAINDGAEEVNIIMNNGAIKAADLATVKEEVEACLQVCSKKNVKVFSVFEIALYDSKKDVLEKTLSYLKTSGVAGVAPTSGFKGFKYRKVEANDNAYLRKFFGSDLVIKSVAESDDSNFAQLREL